MVYRKITIEIIYKKEEKKARLFNFRIKRMEEITDRQRINFKADNKTLNISDFDIMINDLKEKLREVINFYN